VINQNEKTPRETADRIEMKDLFSVA